MQVADLIEARRKNWLQLEQLCDDVQHRRRRTLGAPAIARFAALYRAACADLALADAYQLPPRTVQYLHHLVGRAHNQLYRSRTFDLAGWGPKLLVDVPQSVFGDRCVQLCFCLFWGVFILSACLAAMPGFWPTYAEDMLSQAYIDGMEESFSRPVGAASAQSPLDIRPMMFGFYVSHNTSIGLKCFVFGLAVVPGLYITVFNAAHLGAAFGYMARPDVPEGVHFYDFVTAHGPFELTAIVLSAGAGLGLGMSWLKTNGLTRSASLRRAAAERMPVMGSAMLMFAMAALIEGFLSPTAAPYWIKATVAILTSGLLMYYFVVLGYPRESSSAA